MIPLRFLQTWCEQCTCSVINLIVQTWQASRRLTQAASAQPSWGVSLEGLYFTGCDAPGVWDLCPYMPYFSSYSLVGDHFPSKISPDGTHGNWPPELHQEVQRVIKLILPITPNWFLWHLVTYFNHLYASHQPNGSESYYVTLSPSYSFSVN